MPARVAARAKKLSIRGKDLDAGPSLFRETLGEFDQDASVGRIPDFSEGNDEPQSFDNIQIDFIVAKQLQQFVTGVIGIVDVHRKRSGRP
jgi:hypothetical protein